MPDEAAEFSAIAARFNKLGAADRKAVLANFSAAERAAFERELAEELKARRGEKENARLADQQFVGYSTWLATIVENTGDTERGERRLTKACENAVLTAHKATCEQADEPPALFKFLRDLGLPVSMSSVGKRA